MLPIYLDYHATTPIDPRVAAVLVRNLTETFGNAHSRDHVFGDRAEAVVDTARTEVAMLVGAAPADITFTSGSTEAINLAMVGLALQWQADRRPFRIAVSAAEHLAVLETAQWLADRNMATMVILPVTQVAHVELEALESCCAGGLDLACVMAANNEVGTITNLTAVSRILQKYGVLWMCDATQAAGKMPITMAPTGPDLLSLSAHKFYGPKGIGALAVRPGIRLTPLMHGGGHERGLRSGTLNVPSIAALGEAARLRRLEMGTDEASIARLRDSLFEALRNGRPDLIQNGDPTHRLAGNLHVSFPNLPNQAIIARVRDRLAISTGSACSSGIEAPSHVLRAMGLSPSVADGALRFGLGKFVTSYDVMEAAALVLDAAQQVEKLL
jgi:cysteine desulfurase